MTKEQEKRLNNIFDAMARSDKDFLLSLLDQEMKEKEEANEILHCIWDDDRFEFGKLNPHNGIKKRTQDYLILQGYLYKEKQ